MNLELEAFTPLGISMLLLVGILMVVTVGLESLAKYLEAQAAKRMKDRKR